MNSQITQLHTAGNSRANTVTPALVDFAWNRNSCKIALVVAVSTALAMSVFGAAKDKPTIKEVVPAVSYPDEATNGFVKLKILGEKFPTSTDELVVRFGKQGKLNLVFDPENQETNTVLANIIDDSEIDLSRVPRIDTYPRMTIQIGKKDDKAAVFSDPFPILVSQVNRDTPLLVAALATVVIVLVLPISLLLFQRKQKGESATYRVGNKTYNIFLQLFLDPETDTYSLSKFQFYAWTAASVFGYTYLTVARSMVQGIFDFAQIPQHLPALILISGSTTAVAQAVTSVRGPKGAGSMQPSFADFITTGGIVAVERLQFFVWTCLGVAAFVFMVLMHDPGAIIDLPQIPKEFLYLMGLSSLGYVGGKAARRPGPVIDDIKASFASLILEMHGRNLSKDASFEVNGEKVTLDLINPSPDIAPQGSLGNISGGDASGIRVIEAEAEQASNLAKVLEFTIKLPKAEWFQKSCQLAIINPDGQRATWPFEYKGMLRLEVRLPEDKAKSSEIIQLLSARGNPQADPNDPSKRFLVFDYAARGSVLELADTLRQRGDQVSVLPMKKP